MIRAIIFDMDGVLVDSEFRTISRKRDILIRHGLNWTDELCQLIAGKKLKLVIEEVLADATEEQRQAILDEYYGPENKGHDYSAI